MEKVLLVTSQGLGKGSDELGFLLSRTFIHTLSQEKVLPKGIIFINSGVKLLTEEELVDDFKRLEKAGVQLFPCGTCLDYYELKEKLQVGRVSNMKEIVSLLTGPDLIVTV